LYVNEFLLLFICPLIKEWNVNLFCYVVRRKRMRVILSILFTITTLAVTGCNGEVDAGLSLSWAVVDQDDTEIPCGWSGAQSVEVVVVDSAQVTHPPYVFECSDGEGKTDWDFATGPAQATVSLVTEGGEVLSETAIDIDLDSGRLGNDLGEIRFSVNVEYNASLDWEWRKATVNNWVDPEADAIPFDEAMCSDMGIDHVTLSVWDDGAKMWWNSSSMTEILCSDSGLSLENFLPAGTYKLQLGFYKNSGYGDSTGTTEILVYSDSAGESGDDKDGVLGAGAVPRYFTVFETDETAEFGVLKINIEWGLGDGASYGTCEDVNVKEMAFLLGGTEDDWIAAEVELGDGLECLDWLNFEEIPVLEGDGTYELLVTGLSEDDEILWSDWCVGLSPEVGVDMDDAEVNVCQILYSQDEVVE
jgi:hypothetical protein